nr:protein HAPLESS 2 isoform X1 [Ipomoea batatas]
MKPNELITRAFKLNPSSDQAANYFCSAILKDSDFGEVDRAECQFTTTATVFDNGSQIPFQPPKTSIHGFFETIGELWNKLWEGLVDFLTGESCRYVPCVHDSFQGLTLCEEKLFELMDMIRQVFTLQSDSCLARRNCSGIFDVGCHVQYICMNWIVLVALFAAIFPTLIVLVWLLHQKGIFDPIYDWWEDHFSVPEGRRSSLKHHSNPHQLKLHLKKHHHKHHETRHHLHHHHHKHQRRTTTRHPSGEADYRYYLHHVHKDSRHRRAKGGSSGIKKQVHAREHHNKGAVASSSYAFISQV